MPQYLLWFQTSVLLKPSTILTRTKRHMEMIRTVLSLFDQYSLDMEAWDFSFDTQMTTRKSWQVYCRMDGHNSQFWTGCINSVHAFKANRRLIPWDNPPVRTDPDGRKHALRIVWVVMLPYWPTSIWTPRAPVLLFVSSFQNCMQIVFYTNTKYHARNCFKRNFSSLNVISNIFVVSSYENRSRMKVRLKYSSNVSLRMYHANF